MKTRTLYTQHPELFDMSFDPDTGVETVSFIANIREDGVRVVAVESAIGYAAEQQDAKGVLKYYACCWLGRAGDLDRCTGLGVKEHENGQIELRLRFGPPWYWRLINESRDKTRAAGETPADYRKVGAV